MPRPPRFIDYPEDRSLLIQELTRIASDKNFAPSVHAAVKFLGIQKNPAITTILELDNEPKPPATSPRPAKRSSSKKPPPDTH